MDEFFHSIHIKFIYCFLSTFQNFFRRCLQPFQSFAPPLEAILPHVIKIFLALLCFIKAQDGAAITEIQSYILAAHELKFRVICVTNNVEAIYRPPPPTLERTRRNP